MTETVLSIIFVILIHMAIDYLVLLKKGRIDDLESRYNHVKDRIAKDKISQSELEHELSEITKGCRKE